MKNSPLSQTSATRGSRPSQLLCLRFAAVVACLCLGGALCLPALISATGKHHMPKGQLLADARTLVATVHYLFEAEPDLETKPARFADASLSQGQPTNILLLEISAGLSNPAVPFDDPASRRA